MIKNKQNSHNKPQLKSKLWLYIRKNGATICMLAVLMVLIVSPDAKTFVLKQLVNTGLFNAGIDNDNTPDSYPLASGFEYEDQNGILRNTEALRGKVVFINFWASWCPPCRAEFPSIEKLYANFKDNQSISFITINEDRSWSAANNFMQKEQYTVPFYKTAGSVSEQLYSGTLPTTVVLDKKGHIRFHHTGFANYASEKFTKQIEDLIRE